MDTRELRGDTAWLHCLARSSEYTAAARSDLTAHSMPKV